MIPYKESRSLPLLTTFDLQAPVDDDSLVIGIDHPQCKNSRLVGGKGSQLAVLYQAKLQTKVITKVHIAECLYILVSELIKILALVVGNRGCNVHNWLLFSICLTDFLYFLLVSSSNGNVFDC